MSKTTKIAVEVEAKPPRKRASVYNEAELVLLRNQREKLYTRIKDLEDKVSESEQCLDYAQREVNARVEQINELAKDNAALSARARHAEESLALLLTQLDLMTGNIRAIMRASGTEVSNALEALHLTQQERRWATQTRLNRAQGNAANTVEPEDTGRYERIAESKKQPMSRKDKQAIKDHEAMMLSR